MRHLALSVCTLLLACAAPTRPPRLAGQPPRAEILARQGPSQLARATVIARAEAFADGAPLVANGYRFDDDAVGFVRAAYWQAGIELFSPDVAAAGSAADLEILFRSAPTQQGLHFEQPRPGDLLYLDGDGKRSEPYPAQVAIVERVEADGTISALGHFAGGARRITLNLRDPSHARAANGKPINDALRGATLALAAQLFRAFADPFDGRPQVTAQR